MTLSDARAAVRELGLALRYDAALQEYRVNYRTGDARRGPDSAYFTNDRQDAVDTARALAAWQGGRNDRD